MKRIAKYFSVLAIAASFSACQEAENDWYVKSEDRILEVTEANVTFSPSQSTGEIVINTTEALSASSSEDWCTVSVSGNKVAVSVEAYEGIEARNAVVAIKSATRSIEVPVHQEGTILIIGGEKSYFVQQAGGSYPITFKSNLTDMTIAAEADWITLEETKTGYTIKVAANESEDFRRGAVTLGPRKIWFGQLGTATPSPVGKYTAYFQDQNEEGELEDWYQPGVEIVAGSAANTFLIRNLAAGADETGAEFSYDITLNYNTSNKDYYIGNALNIGKFSTYTLRCMADYKTSATGNYTVYTSTTNTATSAYRMSFAFGVDDEANLVFKYVKNSNMNANYVTPGFSVYAYTSTTSVSATYRAGYMFRYWDLKLVKE